MKSHVLEPGGRKPALEKEDRMEQQRLSKSRELHGDREAKRIGNELSAVNETCYWICETLKKRSLFCREETRETFCKKMRGIERGNCRELQRKRASERARKRERKRGVLAPGLISVHLAQNHGRRERVV